MTWNWFIFALIIGFFAIHLLGGGCGHSHAHTSKPADDTTKESMGNDGKAEPRHASCH